jgi:hypothetical protein
MAWSFKKEPGTGFNDREHERVLPRFADREGDLAKAKTEEMIANDHDAM